ncbi:fam-c protein [Plasmodium chabaudi chabaudi]|uniref:Fam-c protein n=1 Tax=Plasmodium chabaudi chabaudi TaxID=31271 RepID=A0A1C6WLS1_PLACU|nr:fam-c protein [Plasmodium chabaudi chabaudi]SCL89217.1 fam-c protein [Plasmodium chabaudi chabaudi]SCL89593.1 fam-c protein [Plasmodium chabaudi chabaudi]VTZ70685.1 fam-c protein [Plasmodium chabaudi chabaudi]
MNKRIFSLVCIVLYALLVVSIHCSEQKHDRSKESGLRSRIIRAIKQIKKSNKKNGIESKCEIQLNNNNNKNHKYDYYRYAGKVTVSKCWGCCGDKNAD